MSSASRRGVTVVELAAVVGFLAVLGTGAVLVFGPRHSASETQAAVQDAERIRQAVETWRSGNGAGCPTITQLQYDKVLPDDARSADPWGQRFRVLCNESNVTVRSAGRDGKPGTPDDIVAAGRS